MSSCGRRFCLLALAILAACGDNTIAQTELTGLEAMDRLLRCYSDAGQASSAIVVSEKFEEVQEVLREAGLDGLNERQRVLYDAIREPTVVANFGQSDPTAIEPHFVPGETTMDDLRRGAGLLEVLDFSSLLGILWEAETLELDYRDPLRQECDSQWPQALQLLCDQGNGQACADIEQFPERDRATIAEACEKAPYLEPCQPLNPPPYLPPGE